tara:strand:+ start:169 stop:546 length:378 start_codon:yes stop_codon:yes gene_type:complete
LTKLYSITELSKLINSEKSIKVKTSNHTLRYWEKEFKQIKPKIINGRRYYTVKQVEQIKFIRHLLKDKGMTISGAKKLLDPRNYELDEKDKFSLKDNLYKDIFKNKTKKLLDKIKKIRNGKKNSY